MKKLQLNEFICRMHEMLKAGRTIKIPVCGRSMEPWLREGRHELVLAPAEECGFARGSVVFALTTEGRYVLHRIIKERGDEVVLMGDGNLYATETARKADVIGVLTHILSDGKEIDARKGRYKRAGAFWMATKPLRRYLMFIYKHTLR